MGSGARASGRVGAAAASTAARTTAARARRRRKTRREGRDPGGADNGDEEGGGRRWGLEEDEEEEEEMGLDWDESPRAEDSAGEELEPEPVHRINMDQERRAGASRRRRDCWRPGPRPPGAGAELDPDVLQRPERARLMRTPAGQIRHAVRIFRIPE